MKKEIYIIVIFVIALFEVGIYFVWQSRQPSSLSMDETYSHSQKVMNKTTVDRLAVWPIQLESVQIEPPA